MKDWLMEHVSADVFEIKPKQNIIFYSYMIKTKSGRPVKVILPSIYLMNSNQIIHLIAEKGTRLNIYSNSGQELYNFSSTLNVLQFQKKEEDGEFSWDAEELEAVDKNYVCQEHEAEL
jgi:hypothetical protein